MALEAETLKRLACGEKWCLTTQVFLLVNKTRNKVLHLHNVHLQFNLIDVTLGHNNLLQLLIHWD